MYIILGANGHIGSALTELLLERKLPVTVVTRSAASLERWKQKGAQVAVVDVHDVAALRATFQRGRRAYLLNPPAPPSSDTDREERATARAILEALEGSGLEKVVLQSTYGAQRGAAIGDLGVLYDFEQGLAQQQLPAAVIRGAYYMSNWDMSLDTARSEGVIDSFFPPTFCLPMVAPSDIAKVAAQLLTDETTGLHHVEGPQHYCSADVAAAFAKALDRPVKVRTAPPDQWTTILKQAGFSDAAARSMAAMTQTVLDQPFEAEHPLRGETTLEQYIARLVGTSPATMEHKL